MVQKLKLFIFCLLLVLVSACKKDTKVKVIYSPAISTVNLSFSNVVEAQPVVLGEMKYVNAAGNMYQVDVLKYYVSNIKLIKPDSTEVLFNMYKLVNEKLPASKTISLTGVPIGTYTKLKFYIGVDPFRNHTGLQDGDLDPAMDMIWDWNTGYIFFKHEGYFKNTAGANKILVQHLATDEGLVSIEVPLNQILVNSSTKTLYLNFNLNSIYSSPATIDFNNNAIRTSAGASEAGWIKAVQANFIDAFTVVKFE